MRPTQLLVVAGAVVAQTSSAVTSPSETALMETGCDATTTPGSSWIPTNSLRPTFTPTSGLSNATTIVTSTDASMVPPDETGANPTGPTAGAIHQPMQGSMAGLLGFLIVGLVAV